MTVKAATRAENVTETYRNTWRVGAHTVLHDRGRSRRELDRVAG